MHDSQQDCTQKKDQNKLSVLELQMRELQAQLCENEAHALSEHKHKIPSSLPGLKNM